MKKENDFLKFDTILIFDFGGQYAHLIARRIRECKVYSKVVPGTIAEKEIDNLIKNFCVKGLILSGGPFSVYKKNAPKCNPKIFSLKIPILGLCYGHQLIAHFFGGKIKPALKKEYGIAFVNIKKPVGVLKGLGNKEKVWMSHSDLVWKLPKKFEILASTENCEIAAFKHKEKPIYGLQWHPEVIHTKNGMLMIKNFVFGVCKCKPNWKIENLTKKAIEEIKKVVDDKKAIIALSGGIDSSTTAVLASKAIGKNLTAVFVDHGFLREKESEFVKNTFKKFNMNLIFVNAKKRFLKKLKNVKDPEKKRKIIGEEFIRIFEEVAKKIKAEYLLQGTIYSDRIESGIKRYSDKIKTHHNVAGLPTKIKFKAICEPLKDLYKDEVRKIAKKIGLPKEIVWRQPFPGPGLAVRIMGKIDQKKIDILKKVDKIVTEEIEKSKIKKRLWQYFAVLTNTKSTGIKGDARAYGYTVAIRVVESKDAMTANFAKIPYKLLENISTRITNEIPQVTRIVYDITNKPPATIEWE